MECGWGWDEVMWLISLRSKGQMVSWNIGFYSTEGVRISGWNLFRKRDGTTIWWKFHKPKFNRFWL